MKQPYVVAIIERDAVEHLPVVVLAHEVPILNEIHGGRVRVDETADLPNGITEREFEPEDEFERLELMYKANNKTGVSFVSQVFGGYDGFVAKLTHTDEPMPRGRPRHKG